MVFTIKPPTHKPLDSNASVAVVVAAHATFLLFTMLLVAAAVAGRRVRRAAAKYRDEEVGETVRPLMARYRYESFPPIVAGQKWTITWSV